jgi:hypothetical protein
MEKKRSSKWVLPVIVLGFAGFVLYSLWHVEPVQIRAAHLARVGDQVVVSGELTNTGPNLSDAQVQVRLFNQQGREVAKRELQLGDLPHGTRRRFSSPAIAAAGATTFTVSVDRGTNMYGN